MNDSQKKQARTNELWDMVRAHYGPNSSMWLMKRSSTMEANKAENMQAAPSVSEE